MVITPFTCNQVSTARRLAVSTWRRVRTAETGLSAAVSSLIQSRISLRLRRVYACRAGFAALIADFAAVGDAGNQDLPVAVVDDVQDAVIDHPQPPLVLESHQLPRAGGLGLSFKRSIRFSMQVRIWGFTPSRPRTAAGRSRMECAMGAQSGRFAYESQATFCPGSSRERWIKKWSYRSESIF
jgi:hypothetical protein